MVIEGLWLRANIAEPVEGEPADSDRDVGASGRGAGADARITGVGAYLILALDVALLRSVVEVSAGLFDKRLPARVRGSGLRTKDTRPGPRRGVARER